MSEGSGEGSGAKRRARRRSLRVPVDEVPRRSTVPEDLSAAAAEPSPDLRGEPTVVTRSASVAPSADPFDDEQSAEIEIEPAAFEDLGLDDAADQTMEAEALQAPTNPPSSPPPSSPPPSSPPPVRPLSSRPPPAPEAADSEADRPSVETLHSGELDAAEIFDAPPLSDDALEVEPTRVAHRPSSRPPPQVSAPPPPPAAAMARPSGSPPKSAPPPPPPMEEDSDLLEDAEALELEGSERDASAAAELTPGDAPADQSAAAEPSADDGAAREDGDDAAAEPAAAPADEEMGEGGAADDAHAAESGAAETGAVETAAVETAAVETAAVETAAVETSAASGDAAGVDMFRAETEDSPAPRSGQSSVLISPSVVVSRVVRVSAVPGQEYGGHPEAMLATTPGFANAPSDDSLELVVDEDEPTDSSPDILEEPDLEIDEDALSASSDAHEIPEDEVDLEEAQEDVLVADAPPPPPPRKEEDDAELKARSGPPPPPDKAPKAPPAPPAKDPEPPRPKKRKGAWWEGLFNDDYLRTVPPPNPRQIQRQCDFLQQRLGLPPGATILDVGCGLGLHAVELTRRGYLVVGLDLSLPMLSRAADEAQDHGLKINFLHADMREMNFDGAFDAVLCLGTTFGYFDDEQNKQVVARLYRALKPKGLLLLDVDNRDFAVRGQPNLVWFEGDGCVVMEETTFNYITSRLHVKRTVILDDGRQRDTVYSIRMYGLHELGQVLHLQGFRVVEVSGREATPAVFFGADSPRLIILAERRVQAGAPPVPGKRGDKPSVSMEAVGGGDPTIPPEPPTE